MLKLVIFNILMLFCFGLYAQNHHFIYLESQNKKPFTVTYQNKIISSAKKNYVHLTQLDNGPISFKIDIEQAKDLSFTIYLDNNDAGFIIKQNANNDWVLFDILNFTTKEQDKLQIDGSTNIPVVIVPTTTIDYKQTIEPLNQTDSNTIITTPKSDSTPKAILLDTSLNVILTLPKSDTTQIEIVKAIQIDSLQNQHLLTTNETIKIDSSRENKTIPNETKIKIVKHAEMLTGIEQKYLIQEGSHIDTIDVFIPYKKVVKTDTVKAIIPPLVEEKKMESKNLDVVELKEVACRELASEIDFNKFIIELQRNPVIKNKLSIAQNILSKKCYSTSQIQRLAVMFMYDKAKLEFFKIAINSVSDIKNFHFLKNEIKDESMLQEFMDILKP